MQLAINFSKVGWMDNEVLVKLIRFMVYVDNNAAKQKTSRNTTRKLSNQSYQARHENAMRLTYKTYGILINTPSNTLALFLLLD